MIDEFKNWTGTGEELVLAVEKAEELLSVTRSRLMSKRTLTYYRTKGVVESPVGKKYAFKHLLQCLLARKLSHEGWKILQIADSVPVLSTSNLAFYLEQKVRFEELFNQAIKIDVQADTNNVKEPEALSNLTEEVRTARILAKGVLKQFIEVENNGIVDGTDIVGEMRKAMSLLSKLRINEGLIDNCSSVHEVLNRCKFPLGDKAWGISKFSDDSFEFKHATLIDPDHRCPTQDCIELANINSDADLRERYSFENFINLCSSFAGRRHEVYTLIRQFIAENPIVESEEILNFLKNNRVKKADKFLRLECYRRLHEPDLIDGRLYKCNSCGSALSQHKRSIGRCITKQCSLFSVDQPLGTGIKPTSSLVILKAHLQLYWFGPAIDEIKIFNQARKLGLESTLFPNSDQCDISIDGFNIGIDVKGYQNPKFLAQKLSKSIGGLSEYREKIIAVNDNLIQQNTDYLSILESNYSGSQTITFKSVQRTLDWLEEQQ